MGQGDPAAVEAFVRAEAEKPANRYASAEAAANSAGYALLNDGQIESAIMLFELNTRVYPASANTWDSLGEALVRANRHPDAIAAFRRALAVDPAFGSSRAWLERLGAR
jgi:tetratricopeptide (TPR) repeat protein